MGKCVSPLANCKFFSAFTFGLGSANGFASGFAFISVSTLEDTKNVVQLMCFCWHFCQNIVDFVFMRVMGLHF
jgi:hypothetical protein